MKTGQEAGFDNWENEAKVSPVIQTMPRRAESTEQFQELGPNIHGKWATFPRTGRLWQANRNLNGALQRLLRAPRGISDS